MPRHAGDTGRHQEPAGDLCQTGQHCPRAATGEQRQFPKQYAHPRGREENENRARRTIRGARSWQHEHGRQNNDNASARPSSGGNHGTSQQAPQATKERQWQRVMLTVVGSGMQCEGPSRSCAKRYGHSATCWRRHSRVGCKSLGPAAWVTPRSFSRAEKSPRLKTIKRVAQPTCGECATRGHIHK